jgi:hypothetical protein
MAQPPAPTQGGLTHVLVPHEIARARRFYDAVLGGELVIDGPPPALGAVANSWIVINTGAPPTDDKPDVSLEPPTNPVRVSSVLNVRVADINAAPTQ